MHVKEFYLPTVEKTDTLINQLAIDKGDYNSVFIIVR